MVNDGSANRSGSRNQNIADFWKLIKPLILVEKFPRNEGIWSTSEGADFIERYISLLCGLFFENAFAHGDRTKLSQLTLFPSGYLSQETSSWEQRKFSDVVDVCSGKDYKHLEEGPIPVYGTGGFMTSVDEALSYDRDAVGIGRKGTIDKPYLLKAPFWTVDTLFYAIPKSDIDLEFAHCSFLNVDWKSKDESTGLPSLSKEAINETIVLVPSFNEQSRLGDLFNNLDNLITLHQREPQFTDMGYMRVERALMTMSMSLFSSS